MRALQGAFWVLSALLLVGFCWCDGQSVVVVGVGDCVDCTQKNIKASNAYSGLSVSIDCKVANGQFKSRGAGKVDKDGKFEVELPSKLVNDKGELTEECFAQLHSSSNNACPAHNGIQISKLVFKSEENGKYTFSPSGKVGFTSSTCTSAFLWPYFKVPPLPKYDPWHKPLPKFPLPPFEKFPFPPKFLPSPPMPVTKPPPKVFPPVEPKPLPPQAPVKPSPEPEPEPEPKPLPPQAPVKPSPEPEPEPEPKPLPPPAPVKPSPEPEPKPKPKPCPEPKPKPLKPKPMPKPKPTSEPKPKAPKPKPMPKPCPEPEPEPKPEPMPEPKPEPKPLPPTFKKPFPPIFKKPLPPFPKLPPIY